MDTTNYTFDDFLKIAKEFVSTKEFVNYYPFSAFDDQWCKEVTYLNPLDDREVAEISKLKEKYGKDFVKHLDEVYDDPDIIHDFTGGDELTDIHLQHIFHLFEFKVHELKPDGTVAGHTCQADLSDDDYARLLAWHLYDQFLTANTLRYNDSELYDTMMSVVDSRFIEPDCNYIIIENPYLVTFDEAVADVEKIRSKYGIALTGGHRFLNF